MRVPSVSPCGAVPWVPSNEARRGNGIGETPEEGGKVAFNNIFRNTGVSGKRGQLYLEELRLHSIRKIKTLAFLRAFNGIFRIFIIFYYNFFFYSPNSYLISAFWALLRRISWLSTASLLMRLCIALSSASSLR